MAQKANFPHSSKPDNQIEIFTGNQILIVSPRPFEQITSENVAFATGHANADEIEKPEIIVKEIMKNNINKAFFLRVDADATRSGGNVWITRGGGEQIRYRSKEPVRVLDNRVRVEKHKYSTVRLFCAAVSATGDSLPFRPLMNNDHVRSRPGDFDGVIGTAAIADNHLAVEAFPDPRVQLRQRSPDVFPLLQRRYDDAKNGVQRSAHRWLTVVEVATDSARLITSGERRSARGPAYIHTGVKDEFELFGRCMSISQPIKNIERRFDHKCFRIGADDICPTPACIGAREIHFFG